MKATLVFALFMSGIAIAARTPANRIVWRKPQAMSEADWVWGPGGRGRAPAPPFQFLKEKMGGTNPKVNVRDARGALWVVKFGGEVHTEVFAARLLSATGFDAELVYFVAQGEIIGSRA